MHLKRTQISTSLDTICSKTHRLSRVISRLQDVEDPNWTLFAEEWPTFLYDEQAGWTKHNIRNGLFWGHVLARVRPTHSTPGDIALTGPHLPKVAIRLFRNKTAAQADEIGTWYNPSKKAKGPKDFVTRHNIKRVTPQMIAYAALQVCLTIHYLPLLTYHSTDVCWTVFHEAVGEYRWHIPPCPLLPPDHENTCG